MARKGSVTVVTQPLRIAAGQRDAVAPQAANTEKRRRRSSDAHS